MAQDIAELIPRVIRAVEGPTVVAGSADAVLNDEQAKALIADAIADIIFYTGGLFGHQLNVTGRDQAYNAPSDWEVDPELTLAEETLIISQAALNHFFHLVKELKVSETIADEAQQWSYSLSANVVTEQIKMLKENRDKALQILAASEGQTLDTFTDFIAIRDSVTAAAIEPWTYGALGGQQFEGRGW